MFVKISRVPFLSRERVVREARTKFNGVPKRQVVIFSDRFLDQRTDRLGLRPTADSHATVSMTAAWLLEQVSMLLAQLEIEHNEAAEMRWDLSVPSFSGGVVPYARFRCGGTQCLHDPINDTCHLRLLARYRRAV